jgi:multisubunit Na+/H+ antiporter MnhF subunit
MVQRSVLVSRSLKIVNLKTVATNAIFLILKLSIQCHDKELYFEESPIIFLLNFLAPDLFM